MINYFRKSSDETWGFNFDPNSIMGFEPALIRDELLKFARLYKDEDILLQPINNGGMVCTIGKRYTIVSFGEHIIDINCNDIDSKTYNYIHINLLTGEIRTNVSSWNDRLLFLMKSIYSILRIEN